MFFCTSEHFHPQIGHWCWGVVIVMYWKQKRCLNMCQICICVLVCMCVHFMQPLTPIFLFGALKPQLFHFQTSSSASLTDVYGRGGGTPPPPSSDTSLLPSGAQGSFTSASGNQVGIFLLYFLPQGCVLPPLLMCSGPAFAQTASKCLVTAHLLLLYRK